MTQTSIPLSRPDHPDDPSAIVNTLREIVLSGHWAEGEYATAFERHVAEECGAIYAIASNSGASALEQVLRALDLKEDDEIICPSYSHVATAHAVLAAGAQPVFAEIDSHSFNLDLKDVERKLTKQTRAVLLVHQYGLPSDGRRFHDFCFSHDLALVEDAACGLGSKYRNKSLGTFGIAGLVSFHPRKVLATGEGGMILTDDEELAMRARSIGKPDRTKNAPAAERAGRNYRMSEFQAAMGLWALERLPEAIARRNKLARRYEESLKNVDGVRTFGPPDGGEWNVQSYPVRIRGERRDLIGEELARNGIETSHGPLPIHMHPFIVHRFQPPRMAETEDAYEETLLLPMYAALSPSDQDLVIDRLVSALKHT